MRALLERFATPATFVVFLAVWSVAARLLERGEGGLVLLPGPLEVLEALWILLAQNGFARDIFLSLLRIALGLGIAVVPAFILGVLFGTQPTLYTAASPLFAFAKYVPPVAFIPILILWLGIGLPQQLALLFIGTFFYLTVMIATTVSNTPTTYLDAAATLGARRSQSITRVIVRYGLPEFIEHLRTMVGIAWTYLVVVEMVAAEAGIGRVIINSQRYLQTDKVLAGVLTIGLLGILSDQLLKSWGWIVAPWRYSSVPFLIRPLVRLTGAARA